MIVYDRIVLFHVARVTRDITINNQLINILSLNLENILWQRVIVERDWETISDCMIYTYFQCAHVSLTFASS